ncbi:hypothetical protein K1T71_005730 [Dendrolimus kikuchii]|uniref:Uncharacterized protein n=1 Tax=Dendrolimus kikuchii TaxID=765133 RepID=A0ACC1D583_9NEOP|nr:hypothetical protein K1T71_005730 [Dendrolimus kikuchii]
MQSLVDMTLMCTSHTLRVHKAVLAASSAYFQEILQKQTGEPLIILKMRFSVLKCLVEFMYCGKTQCLEENLDELVSAAQFLKIKGLSKVTKEGLGITNNNELPVFTPPVVINRPPQSLIDLHSQENDSKVQPPSQLPVPENSRSNKDTTVRIPFDIENGGTTSSGDLTDTPRTVKPRRGRPSVRRSAGWEGSGSLGRAAERVLLRREQDSRKAIHHLKHLQSRHMQDYMDRVTLSQAVNSICGSQSSSNYVNIDNDLIYMDETVSSNVIDSNIPYSMSNETITSRYSTNNTTEGSSDCNNVGSAMSQYVNALKSAGLPTDLPILFESGDGSYINVNEQVLLDMVQSSEIQYEVVEQPNIIEKVADPSEIKSIDDLSKSIERGEMLLNKSYPSDDYKNANHYSRRDAISSLNCILPDSLELFAEQQNYVVLDPRLQENNNAMDQVNSDFSCIDGDMQFFTKSLNDDVKKYYNDQQLNDSRALEQLCPASTTLDTNFNISLLDSKIPHLGSSLNQQYNLHPEELRRNDDCYDFTSNVFKEDALDCLMATPKRNDDDQNTFGDNVQADDKASKERDEIIKDLINIETKVSMDNKTSNDGEKKTSNQSLNVDAMNVDPVFDGTTNNNAVQPNQDTDMTDAITSSGMEWDGADVSKESTKVTDNEKSMKQNVEYPEDDSQYESPVIDLTETKTEKSENWDDIMHNNEVNKENDQVNGRDDFNNPTLEEDIPYAVGLLPLKQIQPTEEPSLLKRNVNDADLLDNVDTRCLKRKVKSKKI